MKRWGIGTNNYFFTGGIYLDESEWYIFLIERIILFICDYFPSFSLPSFIYKYDMDGEKYSLKEYYGTTQDLFHIFICEPISTWCFKKTKTTYIHFPYEMLKEKFPVEFENIEECEFIELEDAKNVKENLKYSKEVEFEFREVYSKLDNIVKERLKK